MKCKKCVHETTKCVIAKNKLESIKKRENKLSVFNITNMIRNDKIYCLMLEILQEKLKEHGQTRLSLIEQKKEYDNLPFLKRIFCRNPYSIRWNEPDPTYYYKWQFRDDCSLSDFDERLENLIIAGFVKINPFYTYSHDAEYKMEWLPLSVTGKAKHFWRTNNES
jgi:hypothetical protein